MAPLAAVDLFLLGLSSGIAILTLTAYRRVSPRWLRWLLLATGVGLISRYAAMAAFATADTPQRVWAWRYGWVASAIGLTLPSVFAVDQLVRHPAVSPKILLRWYAPFLAIFLAIFLLGDARPVPDRVAGWRPHLSPAWQWAASATEAAFLAVLATIGVRLMRRLPSRQIRTALLALIAGHLYLSLDGVVIATGGWYFRPFLYSEPLTLLAIWYAYETSATTP